MKATDKNIRQMTFVKREEEEDASQMRIELQAKDYLVRRQVERDQVNRELREMRQDEMEMEMRVGMKHERYKNGLSEDPIFPFPKVPFTSPSNTTN